MKAKELTIKPRQKWERAEAAKFAQLTPYPHPYPLRHWRQQVKNRNFESMEFIATRAAKTYGIETGKRIVKYYTNIRTFEHSKKKSHEQTHNPII